MGASILDEEAQVDPLVMIGLWGLTLIGIAGVVRAARTGPERNLDHDHDEPFPGR